MPREDLPKWVQNKISYNQQYAKEKYDNIVFRVPKGESGIIKEYAAEQNVSMNKFIDAAVLDACPPLQEHRRKKAK